MAGIRSLGMKNGVGAEAIQPGDILLSGENALAGAIATAGDGTWTAAAIVSGIIKRTGPGAGYTDTTDTSTAILLALAGNSNGAEVVPGSTFRLLVRNTVAQALTWAGGTGIKTGDGTLDIAASLTRLYLVTVLNATPQILLSCATTNASAVVTFVLPTGMVALPSYGPQAAVITPGMTVSGTGITAGTTVIGVTQGVGGLTGVTLSANATATNNPIGLTFLPTVKFDSLMAGTL